MYHANGHGLALAQRPNKHERQRYGFGKSSEWNLALQTVRRLDSDALRTSSARPCGSHVPCG